MGSSARASGREPAAFAAGPSRRGRSTRARRIAAWPARTNWEGWRWPRSLSSPAAPQEALRRGGSPRSGAACAHAKPERRAPQRFLIKEEKVQAVGRGRAFPERPKPATEVCNDPVMATTKVETSKARGRIRLEPGAKRVRAYLGGEVVVDSARPVLVWEVPYYPAYYFPLEDVRTELLEADGGVAHSPSRGDGVTFTVRAGEREAPRAAWRY